MSKKHIILILQTSSLGALNEDLLRAIFLACKGKKKKKILCLLQTSDTNLLPGDDGSTDYQFRNTAPSAKAKSPLQEVCQEWKNRFRVYFPSDYTVNHIARSRNRRTEDIGGTVCFSSKYWESPKFPRDVLMDCPSKRSVMMHNKVCFVTSRSNRVSLQLVTPCLQLPRSSL